MVNKEKCQKKKKKKLVNCNKCYKKDNIAIVKDQLHHLSAN